MSTAIPTVSLFREIERKHEGGRDWDHEGTLATLEEECAVDRQETGCTAHNYYVYDAGHFLVWRDWFDAGRQTVRQCAFDATTGKPVAEPKLQIKGCQNSPQVLPTSPGRGIEIEVETMRGRIRQKKQVPPTACPRLRWYVKARSGPNW